MSSFFAENTYCYQGMTTKTCHPMNYYETNDRRYHLWGQQLQHICFILIKSLTKFTFTFCSNIGLNNQANIKKIHHNNYL